MRYEPHDYQKYAINYIESHPFAAVLLDMGLGKTSITLTAIADLLFDSFMVHKVLVIAPLRVARDTWPAEIGKWDHLSHLTFSVAVGTEAERKAALEAKADIYVINRENVQWLIYDSGFTFDFDMVVIDELSSFKNHQSKRFKALMQVRPLINRVVGLTGTPASNGLMDLWAEFKVIDLGKRLGRFITHYRQRYFMPDKGNGQIVYSYKPLPGAEEAIYRQIADITISMKSTDHLKMPELISTAYKVYLDPHEQEAYDEMKKQFVLELPEKEITAANAAALSGKLCQLANGAIYDDAGEINEIHAKKLDALEDLIEAAN
jgi:SNF2 family DNA or RNA helicase